MIHEKTSSESKLEIGLLNTRPTEIWRMSAEITKAKELLNWEPKISFESGLDKTIEWYRKYLKVFYDTDSDLHTL